jgi:integrase
MIASRTPAATKTRNVTFSWVTLEVTDARRLAMAAQRVRRRRLAHHGVKLLDLPDGRHVARWLDPFSGKQVQQGLDRLLLHNTQDRLSWAIAKAEALAKVRQEISAGGAVAARKTVEKAGADFLDTYGNPGTVLAMRIVVDAFAEWTGKLGTHDIQDVTGPVLAGWRDHLLRPASEHAMSTRNRWLVASRIFLGWCRRQGLVPRLSSDAIKDGLRRAPQPKDPIVVMQADDVAKLLEAALRHDADFKRAPIAPLLLLALLTGMRDTEIRELEWGEVDLAGKCIRLGSARTKTKTGRVIGLDVSPLAVNLLSGLRLRTPGDLVFPVMTRGTLEAAGKRLVGRYKAPAWTMHTLRRTCGSVLVCAGLYGESGTFRTAKRQGHSLVIAEKHYLGVMELPRSAKSIEQALGIAELAERIVVAAGGVVAHDTTAATA